MEATLQTIQDMVTIEDYDVTDCFHHSNSMESVKSTVSESFMSKPSLAKRRANQQETEQFYFTVNEMERERNQLNMRSHGLRKGMVDWMVGNLLLGAWKDLKRNGKRRVMRREIRNEMFEIQLNVLSSLS